MTAIVLGIVGLGMLAVGFALFEKSTLGAIGALVVSALLIAMALSGDPIGWVAKGLRNNNDFAGNGQPNYWYNLNGGKRYHVEDPEVAACQSLKEIIKVDGQEIATCPLFGPGQNRLYAGWGRIIEIADTMKYAKRWDGGKMDILWPGQNMSYDAQRSGGIWAARTHGRCYDMYAVDVNGKPALNGPIEFRHQANGVWSDWYTRPSGGFESIHRWVNRVEIRTMGDLPVPFSGQYQNVGHLDSPQLGFHLYCIQ